MTWMNKREQNNSLASSNHTPTNTIHNRFDLTLYKIDVRQANERQSTLSISLSVPPVSLKIVFQFYPFRSFWISTKLFSAYNDKTLLCNSSVTFWSSPYICIELEIRKMNPKWVNRYFPLMKFEILK